MNAILGIISAFSVPITILNVIGGIGSGIWLAILGEWKAIGIGVGALVISGFAISIALMPSMLLGAPALHFHEKGIKLLFYFFSLLSALYTMVIMTVWCCGVFYYFLKLSNSDSLIPLLIWSYGVATGPWAWLAQKDQQGGENFASIISNFFAQMGYIVMVVMFFFFPVRFMDVLLVFGGIMLFGQVLNFKIAIEIDRETRIEAQ